MYAFKRNLEGIYGQGQILKNTCIKVFDVGAFCSVASLEVLCSIQQYIAM